MINVAVIGAAGRMGRHLVSNIMASGDLRLSGALEVPESPFLGSDAGVTAGCGEAGVKITANVDEALKGADSVIIFSTSGVEEIARKAVKQGASAVVGSTALPDEVKDSLHKMASDGGRIVQAYNMSVGVNLLFKLAGEAAARLGDSYDIEIIEMHHNQKKDAPSGTAVRLGEVVCEALDRKYDEVIRHGREGIPGARTKKEIGMHSMRGGDVVGDHTVIFAVNGERVELTHKASSRDTFALGALRAVRFLNGAKPGIYDMQDVLGLK